MELINLTPKLIQKEHIPYMAFKNSRRHRKASDKLLFKLSLASTLGNTYKSKCKIIFNNDEGSHIVETTIWAVGKEFITLKGGVWIPIDCIEDIELI